MDEVAREGGDEGSGDRSWELVALHLRFRVTDVTRCDTRHCRITARLAALARKRAGNLRLIIPFIFSLLVRGLLVVHV